MVGDGGGGAEGWDGGKEISGWRYVFLGLGLCN